MIYKGREKEWAREWFSKRREAFFCDKKCEWCGSMINLELHHVDPSTKKASVIWSWTEERRNEEIKKCVVLCKECHHNYHNEAMKTWVHGRSSTYKKGCRCTECREAQYATQHTKKKWYKPTFDYSHKEPATIGDDHA